MMNKNLKIIIGVIVVIVLILIIVNVLKSNSEETVLQTEEENTLSDIKYDEDTGEYYIYDEDTGEILHTAETEDELYIYTIDPDYDPKSPSTDEYEYIEENIE